MKNVLKHSFVWFLFLGMPTFSVCAEDFYDSKSEETLYEEDGISEVNTSEETERYTRIEKQKNVIEQANNNDYLPSILALKHITNQELIVTLKSLKEVEKDNKSTLLHLDMYEGSNFATLIFNALDYLMNNKKQKDDSSLMHLYNDLNDYGLAAATKKLKEPFGKLSEFDAINFEDDNYCEAHNTALSRINGLLQTIEKVDSNGFFKKKYPYFIEFLKLAQKITSLVSVRYHTNKFIAAHRSDLERMQNDSSIGADIDLGVAELSWNTVADDVDSASFHTTTTTLGAMGKISKGIFSAKLGYKHAKIAMFYSLEAYMDYLNTQGLMAQKSLDYYMRRADSDFKKALEDRKRLQEKEKEALANCETFEKYLKMFHVLPQTGVSLNWITVTEGSASAEASEHIAESEVGLDIKGISASVTANVSHSWKKYIKETPLLSFIDEDCKTMPGLSADNLKNIIGNKYDLRSKDTRLSVDDLLNLIGEKFISMNDLQNSVSRKYDLDTRIDDIKFSADELLEYIKEKFSMKGGVSVSSFLNLIKEKYELPKKNWENFVEAQNKKYGFMKRIDDPRVSIDNLLESINNKYDLTSQDAYVTVNDLLDLIYKNSDFRRRYTVDDLLDVIGEKYIKSDGTELSISDLKKSIDKSYKLNIKIDNTGFSADGFLDLLCRRYELVNKEDKSDLRASVEQQRKTYTEQLRSIEANTFLGYLDEYVSVLGRYVTDTSKSIQAHKQKCEKNLLPDGKKGREEVLKSMILTSALLREETPDNQENNLRFRKMYNLIFKLAQLVRFSRSNEGTAGLINTTRAMFHVDAKNKTAENLEVKSSKTIAKAQLKALGTKASLEGKLVKGSPFLQENGKYVTFNITLPSAIVGTGLIEAVYAFEKKFSSLLEDNSEEILKESGKKNEVSKSDNSRKESGIRTDDLGFFADAFSLIHTVQSENLPIIGAGVSSVTSKQLVVGNTNVKFNWKWVENANGGQYSLPNQGKILDRKKIPLVLDFITITSRSRLDVTLLGGASVGKAIKVTGWNTLHDITSKFNALSMGKVDAKSDVSTEFLFKEQIGSLQRLFKNIAKMNTNAAFELQALYNDLIKSYGKGGRDKYDPLFEQFISACKDFSKDKKLKKSKEQDEEELLQKGGKFNEALNLFREILNEQYLVIFKPYYNKAFSKAKENMIEEKEKSRNKLKNTVSDLMVKKFKNREKFRKTVDDLRNKSKN